MTALDQLNAYLRRLELRMRLLAATRGAAIIALSAVLLTTILAWLCNRFAFADRVVLPVRIVAVSLGSGRHLLRSRYSAAAPQSPLGGKARRTADAWV